MRSWLRRYLLALTSVGLAFIVTTLTPLHHETPDCLFFAAVVVSSWYGGLGPGLLATILSAAAIDLYLFVEPDPRIIGLGNLVRVGEFVMVALLINAIHSKQRRLEESMRLRAEELAAADRRKDEFVAMLAHELRNPLAPICNAAQLMRQHHCDDPATERAREIVERQARHMARLLDDLLDASRFARGKVTLRRQPVDLAEAVAGAVEGVRPLVDTRGHTLSVSLPRGTIRLDADPARLQQILTNLLNNAAKYTKMGGQIWLTVEWEIEEVVIRVRDNGIGMTPEMQARVFDLFSQADQSLDRSQGGLGIGLMVVRSLAELHGWTVEVRSPGLGQGSEFTVRLLPLPEALPAISAPEVDDPRSETPPRVLLVDDNRDAAKSLAEILDLWGYPTRIAFDGPEALNVAPTHRPDVVLLDIGLPEMDGYEVARRLRDQPEIGRVLLVALTGYVREDDLRRSQEAGFDHHLSKPVDFDVLKDLLAEQRSRRAPSPLGRSDQDSALPMDEALFTPEIAECSRRGARVTT